MDFVYFGRTYTVAHQAGTWKQYHCESCEQLYYHFAFLTAMGSGHSPYLLDNTAAQERADRRARHQLVQDLSGPVPVPCPSCGWYQQAMIPLLRKASYGRIYLVGLSAIPFAFLVWFLGSAMAMASGALEKKNSVGMSLAVAAGAVTLGVGIALLLVRKVLQSRYDPNTAVSKIDRLALGRRSALTADQFGEFVRDVSARDAAIPEAEVG